MTQPTNDQQYTPEQYQQVLADGVLFIFRATGEVANTGKHSWLAERDSIFETTAGKLVYTIHQYDTPEYPGLPFHFLISSRGETLYHACYRTYTELEASEPFDIRKFREFRLEPPRGGM